MENCPLIIIMPFYVGSPVQLHFKAYPVNGIHIKGVHRLSDKNEHKNARRTIERITKVDNSYV